VRVDTDTLDRFLSTVGEGILSSSQLRSSAGARVRPSPADVAVGLDRMDRVVGELQRRALDLRTTPLLRIVEPLPRVAREVARLSGKRVEVEIGGAELDLDRSILDRLSDPLVHLVRNAVDHGIEPPEVRAAAGKGETGRVVIDARRVKDSIRIAVSDDGRGIDLEAVRERAVKQGLVVQDLVEDLSPEDVAAFVFYPGLSTAETISRVSGRGVGMDAVRAVIESLGGSVELATEAGVGTTTILVVPITAAVQRVLLVGASGETLAIPVRKVERIVEISAREIERSGRESFALIDDEPFPVLELAERIALVQPAADSPDDAVTLVVTEVRGERVALRVERVTGQQHIYVKPVPGLLSGVRALAGLTILGDGRPVFLLDLNQLA
jgi:two-component system chemotaxis sensor kinase CheA